MPRKVKNRLRTICVEKNSVSVVLRLVVFLSVLMTLGGDVELNPGPTRGVKQRTLTFVEDQSSLDISTSSQSSQANKSKPGKSTKDSEVMAFLREMKADMKADLGDINNKITNINQTLNDLKIENESLKRENTEMRQELEMLGSKLDKIEGHSRRNNLRFLGIAGRVQESWDESEKVVRRFISEHLNMPEHESVGIERAHRVGSRHTDKCAIIVKFSSFKEKEEILKKARSTLSRNSGYTVREDYTDRVLLHRRELSKKLVDARENGQYASLRHDKLIVDGSVYKYCEKSQQIILLGAARGRSGQNTQHTGGHRNVVNETRSNQNTNESRGQVVNDVEDQSVFEADSIGGAIGGSQ